jgi:uncharacterized protein YaaQ
MPPRPTTSGRARSRARPSRSTSASGLERPARAHARRAAGAPCRDVDAPLLGRGDCQQIVRLGCASVDHRELTLREAEAAQDASSRGIFVRSDDERAIGAQVGHDTLEDGVERLVEARAARDRPDRHCKRAGSAGGIEVAHRASTCGSGGGPGGGLAIRVGAAAMIRAVERNGRQAMGMRDRGGDRLVAAPGTGSSPCRDRRAGNRVVAAPRSPPILRLVKLLVAIVHTEDAGHLVDGLLEREFRATRLHSSGGFLKQSNATVILGVEDDQVDAALAVIRENCHSRTQLVNPMPPIMEPGEFFLPYPLEVEVGGATVFVMPVERFERI